MAPAVITAVRDTMAVLVLFITADRDIIVPRLLPDRVIIVPRLLPDRVIIVPRLRLLRPGTIPTITIAAITTPITILDITILERASTTALPVLDSPFPYKIR